LSATAVAISRFRRTFVRLKHDDELWGLVEDDDSDEPFWV